MEDSFARIKFEMTDFANWQDWDIRCDVDSSGLYHLSIKDKEGKSLLYKPYDSRAKAKSAARRLINKFHTDKCRK